MKPKHQRKPTRRPVSVTLQLGGRSVIVYEAEGASQTLFASSDLFDAILEETGHGKASQKAKT